MVVMEIILCSLLISDFCFVVVDVFWFFDFNCSLFCILFYVFGWLEVRLGECFFMSVLGLVGVGILGSSFWVEKLKFEVGEWVE